MTFVTKATYRLIGNISVSTPIRGLFMIWYVSFSFFKENVVFTPDSHFWLCYVFIAAQGLSVVAHRLSSIKLYFLKVIETGFQLYSLFACFFQFCL